MDIKKEDSLNEHSTVEQDSFMGIFKYILQTVGNHLPKVQLYLNLQFTGLQK